MAIDGLGDVDYRLDLSSPDAAALSLDTLARFEKVIIHFAPGLLPPGTNAYGAFHRWLLKAGRKYPKMRLEIIMHESQYPVSWRRRWLLSRVWRTADALVFHTAHECDRFARHFLGVRSRIQVRPHQNDFTKFYDGTHEEARKSLGIANDRIAFVSCGFFHEEKGFDRAMHVFRDATNLPPEAHYYIVGSPRMTKHVRYSERLKATAAHLVNVTVIEEYLDDETFDQWLAAADCIVLPYRLTWSSGVMARAALYARPVIATDVGGLKDQARPGDVIVADDRQLADAIVGFTSLQTAAD